MSLHIKAVRGGFQFVLEDERSTHLWTIPRTAGQEEILETIQAVFTFVRGASEAPAPTLRKARPEPVSERAWKPGRPMLAAAPSVPEGYELIPQDEQTWG